MSTQSQSQSANNTQDAQSTDSGEPIVRWVDLSAYKIYIGVHQVADGPKRLLLIDETGENEWLAKAMQMSPSKIPGIWFRKAEGESFLLPPECKDRFPKIRAFKVPISIRNRILSDRLAKMRIAHETPRPETGPGWRPDREVKHRVSAEEKLTTAAKEIDRITYCGLNHLGQVVMEDGNGVRFSKLDNKVVAWETEDSSPDFLRVSDDQDLQLCAKGLVTEMQSIKMRSAEFERYLRAIFGEDGLTDKDKIESLQAAVDRAVIDIVSKEVVTSGVDSAYMTAANLQQMRPSYYRKDGALPTPPALSLLMQNIIGAKVKKDQFESPRIQTTSVGQDSHGWAIDAQSSVDPLAIDVHDYFIGGVFSKPIAETVVDGMAISRMDHLHIVESLKNRSNEGTSVFAIIADEQPGEKVDPETQALIEWIGAQYYITGITNIDASMIGAGVEKGTRLLIVGEKKSERDLGFVAPKKVPFIFGYEELWSWAASIAENGFQEVDRFGDLRQPNLLQVPYIPASKASEPISMAPRNLMAPMRIALANLVEKTGMTVDDYIASKLDIPQEKLSDSSFLCAEQIDGIAMGIAAIDEGRAFIVADQAGLGKGRMLAAMAAYSIQNGKKVMFLTEKPDLYGDFYRDAKNIGVDHLLDNPFIFNTTGSVRAMDGQTVIHPSSSEERVLSVCRSGEFPDGHNFALATFSMFNQEPASSADARIANEVDEAKEALLGGAAFDEVPEIYRLLDIGNSAYRAKLVDETGNPAPDITARLKEMAEYEYDESNKSVPRVHPEEHVYMARHELEYRAMKPRKLAKEIEKKNKLPLNAWRGYWGLSQEALKDTVLLIDESHNAAGATSKTGAVVRQMTANAASVIFSSATFSKDEDNLPLYARALPSHIEPDEIAKIVTNGGEPMREIFTSILAEDGVMIRREHDTSGINFKPTVDVARVNANIAKKDAIAGIMADMAKVAASIQKHVTANNKDQKTIEDSARFTLSYSGPFSRFYALSRVLSASLNADFTADLAIEALKEGKKPVITTENTMETALKELAGEDGLQGRTLSFKDILSRYMDKMFTVYKVQRKGRHVVSRKVVTEHLTPEVLKEINRIKADIQKLPDNIPISPIDAVREKIEAAGYSFDEITGRKIRLSTNEQGGQFIESIVDTKEGAAKRILSRFNSGELDVICLSNSGSTGISAHADKNFEDVRQRTLIELQSALDIRKRIQIYGRVFRNGQVQPPEYVIPSTGMHHERRLSMIQNNSSRRMSSSVSGNADNNMINREVPEIMNKVGDEVCREWLESRPDIAALMNISVATFSTDEEGAEIEVATSTDSSTACGTQFVDKLTGRLFMLPSDQEAQAWSEIYAEFEAKMEQFRESGYNPLESSRKDIRAKHEESIVVTQSPLGAGGANSTFGKPVVATKVSYQVPLVPIAPETILEEIEKNKALRTQMGLDDSKQISKRFGKLMAERLRDLADSEGFGSVNHALAMPEYNKVKRESRKISHLERVAAALSEAGAVFRVGDINKRFLSLGVTPPVKDQDFIRPSMWKVKLIDVDTHTMFERRLSGINECYQTFNQDTKEVMRKLAQSGSYTENRVVLEGNLFEASRMSAKLKAGEAVSYSMSNGIWKHGFLMPESFSMKDVLDVPMEVTDADEAYVLMDQKVSVGTLGLSDLEQNLVLANSFKTSDCFVKITKLDNGDLEIKSQRPAEKAGVARRAMLTRDPVLKELIDGDKFTGSKGVLTATVPAHNATKAIAAAMDVCRRAGEPLVIHPRFRTVINKHRETLRQQQDNAESTKNNLLAGLGIA